MGYGLYGGTMIYQIEFSDSEIVLAQRVKFSKEHNDFWVYCPGEIAHLVRGEEVSLNIDGEHLTPTTIAANYLINKLASAI